MRVIIFALLPAIVLSGCNSVPRRSDDTPSVSFYDLNEDGVVDKEFHHWKPGGDWALQDENFDGYYDYEIAYGSSVTIKEPVHIAVPRNIHFTEAPAPKPDRANRRKT